MRTLTAQSAITVCLLAFAVLMLLTARRIPGAQPVHRYLWALTGWSFLIQASNSAFHDAFSIYAFTQGPGSEAWESLLAWHPVLNHSRTLLLVAYCGVTCVTLILCRRGRQPPALHRSVAIVVAGMGVGALLGWNEAAFSYLTHFTAVASWDAVELLSMMAVLLVGLSTGLIDRTLWTCLAITAFALALSTVWFVFLSRTGLVGEWAPKAFHIHWAKAVLYVGMNALVVREMRRLGPGRPLRGFYDARPATAVPSLSG